MERVHTIRDLRDARYPRTVEDDCRRLEAAGCVPVFAPAERELYPQPQRFLVQPDPAIADILEGEHRAGFFTGAASLGTTRLIDNVEF